MAAACEGHFNQFLQTYEFRFACKVCSKPESDITYSFVNLQHDCVSTLLLAKKKESTAKWRHIAPLPVYPKPERYVQCRYYREGKGCAAHSNRCTYARSTEEAEVWNLLKRERFTYAEFISKLKQGLPPRQRYHRSDSTVKEIHQKFPGHFMELCADCLYITPKCFSPKSSTSLHCSSRHKHVWKAALVHRSLIRNKFEYNEIRPKPDKTVRSWCFCNNVMNGRQCRHGAQACCFVHSEVEMAVWTAESETYFNRSELLSYRPHPHKQQHSPAPLPSRTQQYPCIACEQTFTSRGCLMNHLNTLQHSTKVKELNSKPVEWKFRDPPPTNQGYKLCERAFSCTLGNACADAHSEAELQEWRRRDKVLRKNLTAAGEQGLLSYQSNLLREYRDSTNKNFIMAEAIAGVTVHCDKELMANGQMEDMPMKWHFKIQSERQLVEVALLKQEPGAAFCLGENVSMPCTYASGEHFKTADMTYDITVSVKALNPGLYEQWLVLDFDTRPVLLQKLRVRVGQPSLDIAEPNVNLGTSSQSLERWHQGNRDIVRSQWINRREEQEELLNEYKPPQISFLYKRTNMNQTPLNHRNYKERMHQFLFDEELAQDKIISRLNIQGAVTLSTTLDDPRYGAKYALPGELFCAVEVPYSLTPDTYEGQLLKRSVQSALIGPISSAQSGSNKVYEAIILRDATSENKMHLNLPKVCCSELKLQPGKRSNVEIQFQLDRLRFCEMHKAVDLLPDTHQVLPNLEHIHSFVSKKECHPSLNSKQQAAMSFIAANEGTQSNAPFLIYGPFGTGKTFMLAMAAKELSLQPQNKVLICTHTNSSADLYVTRHFHDYVESGHFEAKPLRIKAEEARISTTDQITLQYCHRSNGLFSLPDKGTIDSHRIVITTTSMAQQFHDLKLPRGYFTHILIDEASQMLECEALMPLGLAGPNTRVVLAGDHMQMGPKLFSVEDEQRCNHTLLNRLFHFYQSQTSDAALKHRIIFNENYRSTKEIVDFVATHFYVGKIDVIKAVGNVPAHPNSHVLEFHHVRGECDLDTTSMSWYNKEEIAKVAEIIQNVLSTWPSTWGEQDQSSICVLSDGCQVSLIRQELRNKNLRCVTVENIANVQGKQFRIIVMTAVQTRDSLLSSDSHYPEFFNDPCVLNTAMTRAQSKVVVVGDAAALCNFGKCSIIWKDYLEHCVSKKSIYPATLTKDFLAQEALEISNFLKDSRDCNSDSESSTSEIPDIDDPILRELLDEDKDLRVDVTSEGLLDIIQDEQSVHDRSQHKEVQLHQNNFRQHNLSAGNYKHCTLFMDRYDSGYAIPTDDTSLRINIKGRPNIGQSFPEDQVDVEITDADCCPLIGKVVRVIHSDLASKQFVCTVENYDFQVMTPINKCITKIYTPFWKDKPNHIAVRSLTSLTPERFVKINEESRRNTLFVVQVLQWREKFRYPLGIVVQVLPKVTSLDAGLKVLDIEYQLQRLPPPEFLESDVCADLKNRKDYRKITTFTIDPAHSKDLDDAISVRDLDSEYEIGVHIADVASLVPKGSQIDKYAQQNGTTFYPPGPVREPAYMFPDSLTSNYFSLLPEVERNAISLMVKIDKGTNCIKEREFSLSVIRSDRKLSYDEAENILHLSNTDNQRFDTLEGCVVIACHFSEILRKARKQDDWCYKMVDEDDVIGRRRAHMMVEDLMIMYNHAVADWLLNIDNMGSCTPLRCQDKPSVTSLFQLKERFSAFIPLSIHFSCLTKHIDSAAAMQEKDEKEDFKHHRGPSHEMTLTERDMAHQDQQVMSPEAFSVLTSVMRCIESAVESQDIPRILDLVTTSDIYPQLMPLLIQLRRLTNKASNLCSNSTLLSRVGHYDLQLDCYTWASSPIRRYIDVIVQRVLHSALKNTAVEYTEHDISQCCLSFSQKLDQQSKYEKTAQSLKFADKLNYESARKVAFVINTSPGGKALGVSLPLNRRSCQDSIQIKYRDMQLADQPQHGEHGNSVVLEWLRRVYSFTNEHIHSDLRQEVPRALVTTVPVDMWQDMLSSVKQGNHTGMCQTLQDISFQVKQQGAPKQCQLQPSKTNPNPDHYFGLALMVKPGDTLQVQLGTDTVRGMLVPVIQMLIVHDRFEICLEHSKNPILCFSKYALHSTRPTYPTYMEYQKIWKPLCEMEAASSAVAENESIVIEDVQLEWESKSNHLGKYTHMGSFQLPLEKKKDWAINCDLRHVFLCIRLRDLDYRVHQDYSSAQQEAENTDLTEVPSLIWVAHGLTTDITGGEEEGKDYEIQFRINHMSMDFPYGKISRNSKFTVELIPQILPDVRKENAVVNLRKANQLVKNIALGKRITSGPVPKKQMPTRFEIKDHPSVSFPMLNNSQTNAIREALTNPFTVIQGPPGTGKTVVGVHLVYWFYKQNQSVPRQSIDTLRILYCGPSNKSVDVVAVQLLKLKEVLRPLRVYGDQMEMLEFPYPGSNLKLSRHYVREEKPKADLRSITLHHLIREPENPFSSEICSFDARIKRQEDLTDLEIESYKKLLSDAKYHELQRYDIVLCTCTTASNPFISTLHFQQIIIDECAMATEPEAFIPLVAHNPAQIVLLGDHKQLQPILQCDLASRLGMNKSLFERYTEKALMLDIQYRMHESICKFPSMEFYNGKLKSGTNVQITSVLLNESGCTTPIIFGHVNGQEISLVVSTQHGNENSKANVKEAEQTVRVALLLIKQGRVKAEDIAILTPYNAQVAKINEIMTREGVRGVTVITIAKSQGSEWRYVIISTVRSCPKDDIEPNPPKAWLMKRLGFVTDPNQMNVGITRAQHGLCIIGNRELLHCSFLWKRLLKHYREHNCVLDSAMDIQVLKPRKRRC